MKKYLLIVSLTISVGINAQSYTLADITSSIKTFNSMMVGLEGPRTIIGSYDTAELDKTYFKFVLKGELWAAGSQFGSLYQVISFDARDISNDVTVVPVNTGIARWDVVLKTKKGLNLIHFRNEQISSGTHFIRVTQDVSTINFIFSTEDAANRFKRIAKAVFK